jgi:hypothetical protein
MINLGSFLASHKSKIFLAMRETPPPFKPPKQVGKSPFWHPLMYLLVGGLPRKSGHFFKQHFSNKNKCWRPKLGILSPFETPKRGEGVEKGVYIA